MKSFSYRARTQDGAEVKGRVAAERAVDVVRMLAADGRTVVHIEERNAPHLPVFSPRSSRLSAEERIAFFQETATLLGAGLPIHEALARIAEGNEPSSAYGSIVRELHQALLRGTALSQAMEMHAGTFSPSVIGMVRSGEESGTLDAILAETAAFLTEEHTVRESVKSALSYPIFLLAATLASVLLMTAFVLPIFAGLLRDLGTELPLPTRMLIALSDTVTTSPHIVGVLLCGILLVGLMLRRVPTVRFQFDGLLLRLPVIGTFLCLVEWRMLLRTLAILLRAGIRLDRAVRFAQSVTKNRALAYSLVQVEEALLQGRSLAQAMGHCPFLPPLLRGMMTAGEAAGELEQLLARAADYCQRICTQYAARMERLAEPLMVVCVAAVIFGVVLSFMLPVFDAMDALM